MNEILFIGLVLCALALVLTAVGVALVWKGKLKNRNLNAHAQLAASLTAAAGYVLTQRSPISVGLQDIDLAVSLGLAWVISFIFFWVCTERALNSHKDSADFQESSVLSMLYEHSRQDDLDFPPTELMSPRTEALRKDNKL
jgi:hypothetical protein